MAGERWRLLPFHRGSSAEHFRRSDALARRGVEPTLWWHAAEEPTLILGPAQRAFSPSDALLVRRAAGGTAVYATPAVLGQDIFLPGGHPLAIADIVEAYRWVGELWVEALGLLGIETRLVTIPEARADSPPADLASAVRLACFGTLSPYEVVAGGRKLVGLAQLRRRAGVLWQAGIHRSFDAHALAALLHPEAPAPLAAELDRRAVGLASLVPDPPADEDIMSAFSTALTFRVGIELVPGEWSAEESR